MYMAYLLQIRRFHTFYIVLYMMFVVLCGNSVLCGTFRFFAVISDTPSKGRVLNTKCVLERVWFSSFCARESAKCKKLH